MPDLRIERVLETCLCVDDLVGAEQFYRQTLGLEFVSRHEGRHVFFRIGRGMLLLFDPRQSAAADATLPPHGTTGSSHVAFAVDQRDLPAWQTRLEQANIAIEQIKEWPSGGRSLYFRDPAGNLLELSSPSIWGIDDE